MGQIFHPSTNTIARVSIFGGGFIAAGVLLLVLALNRSTYVTQAKDAREQPIPFSHKHHVEGLGIDCRYCHTAADVSSSAGIPSTKTCMTCHSIIWKDAEMLEPVRESYRTDKPIEWTRVHDLPDYAYFNHSIHVKKGIGCTTCHGPVDQMPLMWKENSLWMEWCLQCHRAPEKFIRPADKVWDWTWKPGPDHAELGRQLVDQYKINVKQLENCSVCHR